jgi:hypothetical protein
MKQHILMDWKTEHGKNVFPNLILMSINTYQNSSNVFGDMDKFILTFTWKSTGPRRAVTILEKKKTRRK